MTDHTGFALKLHRVAVPDPASNACWSPFSVAGALALAREAARGQTRAELDALLGDFNPDDALDVPELAVANTLWADDRLALNPAFSLAKSVRRAPFATAPDTVRKLVNADVEETTRGLIRDLLDHVPADAVAIIVNALYLKVGWLNEFPVHATAAAAVPRTRRGRRGADHDGDGQVRLRPPPRLADGRAARRLRRGNRGPAAGRRRSTSRSTRRCSRSPAARASSWHCPKWTFGRSSS